MFLSSIALNQRDGQRKRGALLGIGLTNDRAMVLFGDDLVTDGQAESSAFAHFFGGKEWVEDMSLGAFRNPRAIVLDADDGVMRGDVSTQGDFGFLGVL